MDGKKEVALDSLSPQQLEYIGKNIEQEVTTLSASYTSLKVAFQETRFGKSSTSGSHRAENATPPL